MITNSPSPLPAYSCLFITLPGLQRHASSCCLSLGLRLDYPVHEFGGIRTMWVLNRSTSTTTAAATRMAKCVIPLLMLLLYSLFQSQVECATPKDVILDTDVDIEDVMAILYLLKQNRSLINLKAITIDANAWVNPGFGVNMVYDLLYMMGRDDIPVGVGGEGGITYDGTILPNVGGYLPIIDQMLSTAGSCRYRQAIPPGRGGGTLDIDTNFGLRRKFLPQGNRHYIPGKQKTAQRVMLEALSSGSNTVLLIGSHTNFAILLMSHPEIKKNIEHVYIMGGGEAGNLFTGVESNPRAEFNIFDDPFASYQVFHSGLPITLVPLEATNTVPLTETFLSALGRNLQSLEANYSYQTLNMVKATWPESFSKNFYMWDSFTSSVAVSGMLNGHYPQKNEFANILYANMTIVTSNKPYGCCDGSNPLFETGKWHKLNLKRGGVHSGHVQTGLHDPFCYVPRGQGYCMDGCTLEVKGKGGVTLQVATSAKVTTTDDLNEVDKKFCSSFIKAMDSPHQTARFNLETQFPHFKEVQYKLNRTGCTRGKPVVFDMDMSPGDILTLLYLLKIPTNVIDVKAITVTANGWANAAAMDVVYDVLHMMGRDDIPVGLGAFFALGQAYLPSNTTGDCKYRKAVPQGSGGLLDSDTLYGLARELPRSPRRYAPGKSLTAREEFVNVFDKLENGSKLTILTGGPLTNIARLLIDNPSLEHLIHEVYVLGGSISSKRKRWWDTGRIGNVYTVTQNTKAEFNMFLDPQAAQEVLLNSNLNITLVPLDVRDLVSPPTRFMKRLKSKYKHHTPESTFARELLHTVQELKAKEAPYISAANPLDEVVAAAVLVNPAVLRATFKEVDISVEASGDISTDGWIRIDHNHGARLRYVERIDTKALDFHVAEALTNPHQTAVVPSFSFQKEIWSRPASPSSA